MIRAYPTLKKLRAGEVVDLDGILVKMDQGAIKPSDMYVAERNKGPRFLTAAKVDTDLGCIFPTTLDYPYDLFECVKVCEA